MNVGKTDRLIRIVLGLFLVALAFNQTIGAWGYIGVVLLITGFARWCPLYTLLGFQTCLLHEQVKR